MGKTWISFLLFAVVFTFASLAHADELTPSKYRKITKDEKTKEQTGNCIFSDKVMKKDEEDKYEVKDTLTCGEYENIYVRCYAPKKFGDYEHDEVQYFAKTSFGEAWLWNSLTYQAPDLYRGWDQFRTEFYGSDSDFKWMYNETPEASWHCDEAKKQKLKEFDINFVAKIFKKIGADYKTEWDDVQKAYITKEIPKYGDGKEVVKGKLKILVPDSYKIQKEK